MFITPISLPLWVCILLAIAYGLAGAAIASRLMSKSFRKDFDNLSEAYTQLNEDYSALFKLYKAHDEGKYMFFARVFDVDDRPNFINTSFAIRFKSAEECEKLLSLIEEAFSETHPVSMRNILDLCNLPSLADDVYFGWTEAEIREQAHIVQEMEDDGGMFRIMFPEPHILDPELFPYKVEIAFYDPEGDKQKTLTEKQINGGDI
jgi:hypothetical protein